MHECARQTVSGEKIVETPGSAEDLVGWSPPDVPRSPDIPRKAMITAPAGEIETQEGLAGLAFR